jgi:hypothetical protein
MISAFAADLSLPGTRYPYAGDFLPTYATSQSVTAGTYLTSVFPRQQGYSYTGAVVAHSGLVALGEKEPPRGLPGLR